MPAYELNEMGYWAVTNIATTHGLDNYDIAYAHGSYGAVRNWAKTLLMWREDNTYLRKIRVTEVVEQHD